MSRSCAETRNCSKSQTDIGQVQLLRRFQLGRREMQVSITLRLELRFGTVNENGVAPLPTRAGTSRVINTATPEKNRDTVVGSARNKEAVGSVREKSREDTFHGNSERRCHYPFAVAVPKPKKDGIISFKFVAVNDIAAILLRASVTRHMSSFCNALRRENASRRQQSTSPNLAGDSAQRTT